MRSAKDQRIKTGDKHKKEKSKRGNPTLYIMCFACLLAKIAKNAYIVLMHVAGLLCYYVRLSSLSFSHNFRRGCALLVLLLNITKQPRRAGYIFFRALNIELSVLSCEIGLYL